MNYKKMGLLLSKLKCANFNLTNCWISTSPRVKLNQKWRKERGLPMCPNASGKLTDGPDYSYLDGRPTPYGTGQLRRIREHKELTQDIIKLSGEIDFAVERHRKLKSEEENRRKNIISNKLKPKGGKIRLCQ